MFSYLECVGQYIMGQISDALFTFEPVFCNCLFFPLDCMYCSCAVPGYSLRYNLSCQIQTHYTISSHLGYTFYPTDAHTSGCAMQPEVCSCPEEAILFCKRRLDFVVHGNGKT